MLTDDDFAIYVALTRYFEDTGLIRNDLLSASEKEWQLIHDAHLTISEPINTSRLYISARIPELCRAVFRASGKAREGAEREYLLAYARDNHIRPIPKPV